MSSPSRRNDSMASWVRYSVAVYVGLLMAGTLGEQHPHRAPAPPTHDQPLTAHYRIAGEVSDAHNFVRQRRAGPRFTHAAAK